jgi:hypothetical protein
MAVSTPLILMVAYLKDKYSENGEEEEREKRVRLVCTLWKHTVRSWHR